MKNYFNAISLYRYYSKPSVKKIKVVRVFLESLNYFLFNCTIPSTCTIGKGTFCSHRGMSVVIHNNAVIGSNCTIGTCVTVGGRGKGVEGAPTIGDNVYIATGAKILGSVTIGDNAVIGANSVVLKDVPSGMTAVGIPAKIMEVK